MAEERILTPEEIDELNAAAAREGTEQEGDEDAANLAYAKDNLGYTYTPPAEVVPDTTTDEVVDDTGDTAGDIYGGVIDEETEDERLLREQRERSGAEAKTASEGVVDEAKIREETMKRFQTEIDSLNEIYAEKKREESVRGLGRVGSSTAIQARRGLIGSTFGAAQRGKVDKLNVQAQDAIQAEKGYKMSLIQGRIRDAIAKEVTGKTAARKAGGDEYIKYLSGQVERAEARANEAIANMLVIEAESGEGATEEDLALIAEALGMSIDQLKRMYGAKKAEADALEAQATADQDQQDIENRQVLKPGEILLDEEGKEIFTAPEAPDSLDPKDQIFSDDRGTWKWQNNAWVLTNPKTPDDKDLNIVKVNGVDYIVGEDGKLTAPKVPVNAGMLEEAKQVVSRISPLLVIDDGLDVGVGPNPLARYSPAEWFNSKKGNFVASVEQVISDESLNSLIAAKARGATFGALSDTEMAILTAAATKIGSWRVHEDGDPTKKVIGYKTTQAEFLKELNVLKEKADSVISLSEQEQAEITSTVGTTASPAQLVDSYYDANPDKQEKIDELAETYTDEEISQIMGISLASPGDESPFSNVGSDTKLATNWLGNYGQITGYGSPYWKHGLDIDVAIGDPIYSPVAGKVVQASDKGDGFGIRVGIKTAKGNIVYLAHNSAADVKVGDTINMNDLIAKGGNTGNTIPGKGGDGSHIDLTVKKPDGSYYTPREIKTLLA